MAALEETLARWASPGSSRGSSTARRYSSSSMLWPVTIRTTGPSGGSTSPSAASAARRRALHADPGRREGAHGLRDRALGDLDERRAQLHQLLDRERHRHAHGHPVGERGRAVALDRPAGLDAERHHRRPFETTPSRRAAAQAARHADQQRAVADRHDRQRRALPQLLDELAADRRVALELGRLGAVLEEGQPVALGVGARGVLGLVHVGAGVAQLGAELLEQVELRRGWRRSGT